MVCTGSVSYAVAGEIVETPSEQIHWSSVGIEVPAEALVSNIANSLGCSYSMATHPLFVAPHTYPEPMRQLATNSHATGQ